VGIIIDGKMEICDTLDAVCAEKSLEDSFFDIYARYAQAKGGAV
jgi:hypothetical protein